MKIRLERYRKNKKDFVEIEVTKSRNISKSSSYINKNRLEKEALYPFDLLGFSVSPAFLRFSSVRNPVVPLQEKLGIKILFDKNILEI